MLDSEIFKHGSLVGLFYFLTGDICSLFIKNNLISFCKKKIMAFY